MGDIVRYLFESRGRILLIATVASLLIVFYLIRIWDRADPSKTTVDKCLTRPSLITVLTLLAGFLAAIAGLVSAYISSEETAYLHRPHFRVRFATIVNPDPTAFYKGSSLTSEIDILNNGQSDAILSDSHLEIYWSNTGLPGHFPYYDRDEDGKARLNHFACEDRQPACTIKAGGGHLEQIVISVRKMGSESQDLLHNNTNGWNLYLLGYIRYQGRRDGFPRFFDFALQYEPSRQRFFPVKDDPDYAYDPEAK